MEVWREELYLQHHGIKGMRWGVRRFQNADGTLTAAGKKRYGRDMYIKAYNQTAKEFNRDVIPAFKKKYGHLPAKEYNKKYMEENAEKFDKRLSENYKRVEAEYNTPRKSTRELNRLRKTDIFSDTRPTQQTSKTTDKREKAKKQLKSAAAIMGVNITSNVAFAMSGVGMEYYGACNVKNMVLGGAAVVQLARAGYNYVSANKRG